MLFMPPKNESSLRIDRWKIPENPQILFQTDYQKNVSWYFFVIPDCQWRIDTSLEQILPEVSNLNQMLLTKSWRDEIADGVRGFGAVGSKRKHMAGFSVSCVIHKDLVNLS